MIEPRGADASTGHVSDPAGGSRHEPRETPLDDAGQRACLGRSRTRFVRSIVGDAGVFYVQKTDTKVDVGYWLGKRRVWVCVLEKEMLLFARGRRPYVERIPLGQLGGSGYNHVTGEVLLAPIETATVKALRVTPLAGLQILAHIHRGDHKHGLT